MRSGHPQRVGVVGRILHGQVAGKRPLENKDTGQGLPVVTILFFQGEEGNRNRHPQSPELGSCDFAKPIPGKKTQCRTV